MNTDDKSPTRDVIEEALSMQQRRAKSISMRRNKAKMAAGRRRNAKKPATKDRLVKRAKKAAINQMRVKVAGEKGKGYAGLSPAEKNMIDSRVAKKSSAVARIAKKMLPSMRKKDLARIAGKSVKEDVNEQFEALVEKRHHEMRDKHGRVKTDRRFRAFRKVPKESVKEQVEVSNDIEILELISSVANQTLNEQFSDMLEMSSQQRAEILAKARAKAAVRLLDSALDAIHKMVVKHGSKQSIGGYAFDVARSHNTGMTPRELVGAYMTKYGKSELKTYGRVVDPSFDEQVKYKSAKGKTPSGGAGLENTDEVTRKYKRDTPGQTINESFEMLVEADEYQLIGIAQIREFEKIVDRLFAKFGIDFNFTRHFSDRMGDSRNTPRITLKELAGFIKKIYMKQGKSLKRVAGSEAIIKDLQKDLNIPVKVSYDKASDEFDVVMKTIMRKKNFKSPDKTINY